MNYERMWLTLRRTLISELALLTALDTEWSAHERVAIIRVQVYMARIEGRGGEQSGATNENGRE